MVGIMVDGWVGIRAGGWIVGGWMVGIRVDGW